MSRDLPAWPPQRTAPPAPYGWGAPPDERPASVRAFMPVLRRNALLIVGCVVAALAAGAAVGSQLTPQYEAAAAIQIDADQRPLAGAADPTPNEATIATILEVLRSRTLAESVADTLALAVRVLGPVSVPRSTLFTQVSASRATDTATYMLRGESDSSFGVFTGRPERRVAAALVGTPVALGEAALTLAPAAVQAGEIELRVDRFDATVGRLREAITVERSGREGYVIRLGYANSDPLLARDVLNATTTGFVARRQQGRRSEARGTVGFLRGQIDTLSRELKESEDALRRFRERERVVNPEIEGSTQVTRLAALRAERGTVEAERSALSQLLDTLRSRAERAPDETGSVYRRLVAFPTLLRNQLAASYVTALIEVEEQRRTLLTRRTPNDPDVRALTERTEELEGQIRGTADAYLQGLTSQLSALDAQLAQSGQQLAAVPAKEVQFARLQRQPKVFADLLALLQTRLKEEQIKEAQADQSVQILDPAVAPRHPVRPRPARDLALAGCMGLVLGVTAAFARERLDRSVRSRADALFATGAPVLGIVPNFATLATSAASARRRPGSLALRRGPRDGSAASVNGGGVKTRRAPAAGAPAIMEAYARLFMNIAWTARTPGPITIVITSPLPGDGKTTTATNLAITLAQRGERVLLVDADMRRGHIGALLNTPGGSGLAELLTGAVPLESVLRGVAVGFGRTLTYVAAGATPSHPAALLQSEQMRALHERLRRGYDVVIYDTPPLNVVSDAAILGPITDGVLVVARSGVTPTEALTLAAEQLRIARATVYGVVLNDVDLKRDASYDEAFQYYGRDGGYLDVTGA